MPIEHNNLVSKNKLIQLIDSIFELKFITTKDLDLMKYYASLLTNTKSDSVKIYNCKYNSKLTKLKLAHLIDSVLDLKTIRKKDIDLLNYYSCLLNSNTTKQVFFSDLNLNELNFYTEEDEKLLFPLVPFDSLPHQFNLVLENDFLSYYYPPVKGLVTSNYGWRDKRMHKGIDIDLKDRKSVV